MKFDYELLSRAFQDAGQAIRAGDPRLARIDIFVPGFWLAEIFHQLNYHFNVLPEK